MLQYRMITNAGERKLNEDAIGCFQKGDNYCFILCDGLGGHGMGDVASSIVKDTFKDKFAVANDMAHLIEKAFIASQDTLMLEQEARFAKNKMKTTAAALVCDKDAAYIGHVGDSRVYVFLDDTIKVRTMDHSIPQMLVLIGEIAENEIRNHPDRNIVLRALGIEWEKPMFELMQPLPITECQAFLLCSDGFWEYITEEKMSHLLKASRTVEEWLKKMTVVVQENGYGKKMDNYSAIAIWNTDYFEDVP